MLKIIILIVSVIIVTASCTGDGNTKNGDDFIGTYTTKAHNKWNEEIVKIKKAGSDGYFVNVTVDRTTYSQFCQFDKDCFSYKNKNQTYPFLCVEGNKKVVFTDGTTFIKK